MSILRPRRSPNSVFVYATPGKALGTPASDGRQVTIISSMFQSIYFSTLDSYRTALRMAKLHDNFFKFAKRKDY